MKSRIYSGLCSAGLLFASGFGASAGPLQRADLPADPAWVLHVDCDGLRPTAIGQYFAAQMENPEVQAKFAAFQAIYSFDPRKHLHGLTLYSTGLAPEDGVLVVYADFDPNRLMTLAKAAQEYQSTEHNRHLIASWLDNNRKGKHGSKPRVYAAIQGSRVIFGQKESAVASALDVLDGARGRLSSSGNFPQLGAPGSTAFLQGAARKLDLPDGAPNAALLRLSKQLRLDIGQLGNQMTAVLTLEANSEEAAQHMATIAQGLVALMKLQQAKPEATKIAEALSLKQEGASLVANLALPATDVVEMLKAQAARKAARKDAKE